MNMQFIDRRVLLVAEICTLMKGSLSQLASPVIVSETDTARFRWQIPAGDSFVALYVMSPLNNVMLSANAANQSRVYGNYTTRVTYKGALSVRTMAFDLSDVQTADSGTYKCGLNTPTEIIDDCGQKLIVLGQPTKPVLKVPSTPVVGRQVTLTCSSTSTTVPSDHGLTLTYTWQKDNTDITVTSPGSPYIFRVNSRDPHSYRCKARESQGLESQWSDVYNMVPDSSPVFSKDSNNGKQVWAEVNQNVTLSQYIYCKPNCTSTSWNFTRRNTTLLLQQTPSSVSSSRVHLDMNGVEVEGYKLSYNVINFQQEDVGLYTVNVCNSVGCAMSSVTLTGSGPPVTPASFTAINSTTNSVTLSWVPQYAGGSYIQEFHVEYSKTDTTDWMVKIFPDNNETIMSGEVDGLSQGTMYIFRIKSVSDRKTGNNQSPFSPQTTIQTKDGPIILPSPSALGVGAGIGIGVGISALVAVGAISGFIIWRRRKGCNSGDRKRQGGIDAENQQTDDLQSSRTQQSVYTQLQYTSNKNTYEKISHPNQNTGFEMSPINQDVGNNLGKQEYETLGKNVYVNTPAPGQTYENTSFNVD